MSHLNRSKITNSRFAFTLVELLVVIAIIGLLIGLLLPAVQAAREAARRMQCANNLKQLGLAMLNYESVYKRLPRGMCADTAGNLAEARVRTRGHGWGLCILPFMEQQSLYNQFDFRIPLIAFPRGPATNANEDALSGVSLPTFLCPSDRRPALLSGVQYCKDPGSSSYVGNFGTNGYNPSLPASATTHGHPMNTFFQAEVGVMDPVNFYQPAPNNCLGTGPLFAYQHVSLREIQDGLSNTALLFEQRGDSGLNLGLSSFWAGGIVLMNSLGTTVTEPNRCTARTVALNSTCVGNLGSFHPSGLQSVFCDGSVRFISNSIETGDVGAINRLPNILAPGNTYGTWQKLSVMNDGGIVEDF